MRVQKTSRNRSRATAALPSQTGRAPATAFSSVLTDYRLAEHQAVLDKLFVKLEAMMEVISTTTSLLEWEKFRSLVLAYLEEVKNGYRLRKQIAWDPRGNQKLLVLVEAANQELVELGLAFLERADDNLRFLARLKRLKGLLLDMRS